MNFYISKTSRAFGISIKNFIHRKFGLKRVGPNLIATVISGRSRLKLNRISATLDAWYIYTIHIQQSSPIFLYDLFSKQKNSYSVSGGAGWVPGEGRAGLGPVQAQPAAGGAKEPAGAAPGRAQALAGHQAGAAEWPPAQEGDHGQAAGGPFVFRLYLFINKSGKNAVFRIWIQGS